MTTPRAPELSARPDGPMKLVSALKELHGRWDRVRTRWNDPVAKAFEKEFLASLDGRVRTGAAAMEQMRELVEQARRECE